VYVRTLESHPTAAPMSMKFGRTSQLNSLGKIAIVLYPYPCPREIMKEIKRGVYQRSWGLEWGRRC